VPHGADHLAFVAPDIQFLAELAPVLLGDHPRLPG